MAAPSGKTLVRPSDSSGIHILLLSWSNAEPAFHTYIGNRIHGIVPPAYQGDNRLA